MHGPYLLPVAAFGIVECCDRDHHLANFLLFVPCPPYPPSESLLTPGLY